MALRRRQAADALETLAAGERSVMRDALAANLLETATAPVVAPEPFRSTVISSIPTREPVSSTGMAPIRGLDGPKVVILSDEDYGIWMRAGRWRDRRNPGDPWTAAQVRKVVAEHREYEQNGRRGAIAGCKEAIAGYKAQLPALRDAVDAAWKDIEALPELDKDYPDGDGRRLVRLRWVAACSAIENTLSAIADNRREIERNKGGGTDAA